jgi:hypothetical protein
VLVVKGSGTFPFINFKHRLDVVDGLLKFLATLLIEFRHEIRKAVVSHGRVLVVVFHNLIHTVIATLIVLCFVGSLILRCVGFSSLSSVFINPGLLGRGVEYIVIQ